MNQEQIKDALTGRLFANRELHEKHAREIAAALRALAEAIHTRKAQG